MNIKQTYLYQLLQFWRRFENGFTNVNEIYFLIYGYTSFMHQENVSKDLYLDWVGHFQDFLLRSLREIYYPEQELRSVHFGVIINEFEKNSITGINLFYRLLDEFVESQERNLPNQC